MSTLTTPGENDGEERKNINKNVKTETKIKNKPVHMKPSEKIKKRQEKNTVPPQKLKGRVGEIKKQFEKNLEAKKSPVQPDSEEIISMEDDAYLSDKNILEGLEGHSQKKMAEGVGKMKFFKFEKGKNVIEEKSVKEKVKKIEETSKFSPKVKTQKISKKNHTPSRFKGGGINKKETKNKNEFLKLSKSEFEARKKKIQEQLSGKKMGRSEQYNLTQKLNLDFNPSVSLSRQALEPTDLVKP